MAPSSSSRLLRLLAYSQVAHVSLSSYRELKLRITVISILNTDTSWDGGSWKPTTRKTSLPPTRVPSAIWKLTDGWYLQHYEYLTLAACPAKMAPDRYYAASVDATTVEPVVSDSIATSRSQVRRSLSIFSRKGGETTEPSLPFIAQEAMRQPKPMNERQKGWVGRRMSVRSISPKTPKSAAAPRTPKGTILNAVPRAKTITMTPLEEEIATSPNDEILSAISDHAPTLTALTASQPSTPIQKDMIKSKSATARTHRSSSRKRRESASRIGVWVNGVVHWDEDVLDAEQQEEQIEETGFTCVRPTSGAPPSHVHRLVRKPHLSVTIPLDEPLVNDQTVSTILQPQPRRVIKSVAPASIVSKFARTTPAIVLNEAETVSPLEAGRTPEMVPQARRNVPIPPHRGHMPRHSRSSTSSSCANTDDASYYSRRSSATSVEALGLSCTPEQLEKELPPLPPPTPERSLTRPAVKKHRASKSRRLDMDTDLLPANPSIKHSRSMSELDRCDRDFMQTAPDACNGSLCAVHHRDMNSASPTLSQAEEELHDELSRSTPERDEPAEVESRVDSAMQSQTGSLKRINSVREVVQPPVRAPTIPKRSRKRDWKGPRQARNITTLPSPQLPVRRRSETEVKLPEQSSATTPTLRKSASISLAAFNKSGEFRSASLGVPTTEHLPTDVVPASSGDHSENEVVEHHATEQDVTADSDTVPGPISSGVLSNSAENVLLNILASLRTLDDLFNTAIINKGMYRVYKENEMDLIRTVAFNESAAASEFREWCPPERNIHGTDSSKASSQLEHSPLTYMRCHRRDLGVIESLKSLILQRCQTFIRRETTFALSTPSHPNAGRFNDAFWRIWTFCQIFGCQKGREDDITGQIDWLKGGLLANNQGCVATVNTNLDFDMGSVLLNAPDHFAQANAGGLYATQLYDMTEIWTCLMVLLHGYSGRIEQARLFGVFADCDVVEGDVEKENLVLEEWLAYLMTLGPAVVLEMAEWADQPYPAGFELAKENGWTTWTAPIYTGSRSNFLKEPVAKTYEEQIAFAKLRMQDPVEMEKKERSRQRVASLAAEIRLRRQSSEYKRLPLIDMNSERPMSMYSRKSGALYHSPSHSRRSSAATSKHLPPIPPAPISPNAASLWASPRRISPIIEEHGLGLRGLRGIAENTSDTAVARIVELGFTEGQAKNALRMTDMGDGIRLDRAVELLIRRAT
ncbi:hypothetical protein CLAFUW4_00866 [Fulvia fulva]|uniref:UBA domain-containing protein n=1 Tax=Passalora fulva TaxID=5499 RepID=A0A9Q8P2E6_PASFU|nr:uncharacterized protein CLAFUR5_00869 [Fulvia fulva]KAK4634256.1 hypothetical protein CLAFUR4_00867 [Fulvia fulva]KAK4636702.1 hypothetical protein CLAFUR0_00867 [Fulvia fulva]UJO10920.1 hypothetical protein CLAFUR5_00869 [Fulvia fulva]WPV10017.1 hypothetical protein CLAFUW4_00866 [Fulvia fulva]WPV24756.1 hypothetical protein CLAFUW7_00950 [Fulvia fulva]